MNTPEGASPPGASGGKASRQIGDYVLEAEIGRGGMGVVFRARRASTNEPVALKVMSGDARGDAELVERFRRESRFMLSLDHPNLVKAREAGTADGRPFLVMEYVEGENLGDVLKREGKVAPVRALKIMREVARALEYGSGFGVVHRDLKPQNILLTRDGTAKLADLGLAILAHRKDLRLTAPGTAIGTPTYMSPEQARADPDIDIRSDVYSIGCTFYNAICGVPPFDGPSGVAIAQQHLSDQPVPPCTRIPELDPGIDELLLKCLEKEPEDRYQDFAELGHAIDRLLATMREVATAEAGRFSPPGVAPAAEVQERPTPATRLQDEFGFVDAPPPAERRESPKPKVVRLPPGPGPRATGTKGRSTTPLPPRAGPGTTQTATGRGRPGAATVNILGLVFLALAIIAVLVWYARS